jgi:prepilin peptidase CpaA
VINAALFIAWALAVVLFDCRLRRIPNWLVIAGLVAACALAVSGYSPFHIAITDAALGLIAGLLALMPFYLCGVMGAADVKIFATLGAWCGVHALPALWIAASLAAGIHALYLVVSALIKLKRKGGAGASNSSTRMSADVTSRDLLEGNVEQPPRYASFVVGGRRATPYAALLAVSAIASFTLHIVEVAR